MAAGPNTMVSQATLTDLLENLGDIAPERIRLHPAPGTATEDDILAVNNQLDNLYELVDGLLVEKAIGCRNTPREMDRKCREYFASGVRLVWLVDPETRTVTVHTAPENMSVLSEAEVLQGGDVLTGFSLPVRELLAELDRQGDGATI